MRTISEGEMEFEKKKFFGMEIDIEKGMGNPYRPDNFFPILFLKFIPYIIKGGWR